MSTGACRRFALACVLALAACTSGLDRNAAVRPHGEPEVVVMDFTSRPPPLDALPAGWQHRTFWTRAPMRMSLGVKDGVRALRLATDASASMLMRAVDVDLRQYPLLAWRWFIEQPIQSDIDERTREGDDHPARLFIGFRTEAGEQRHMEIVWGNRRLAAGDYKFIGGFAHYVANGGDDNVGRWHAEQIDLLAIYRKIWNDAAPASVTEIGLFCDSDETKGSTIAWFADLRMKQQAPGVR